MAIYTAAPARRLGVPLFRPRLLSAISCTMSLSPPSRTPSPPFPAPKALLHYARNPKKYWDAFYKRHGDKFFKNRHYLEKDWGGYFSSMDDSGETTGYQKIVLEIGCGAGNTLFPLLDKFPNLFIHACDISPLAIDLVKEQITGRSNQVHAFVCDAAKEDFTEHLMPTSVDVVTMIFMLSAVHPENMAFVLENAKKVIKPGGYMLFRDYAVGDYAQVLDTGCIPPSVAPSVC